MVVSSLALHHMPPDARPAALTEMYRVLHPGGHLLIADFRPPRNRGANQLIGALPGHAMSHNPIDQLAARIAAVGFQLRDHGDQWSLLRYIHAQRNP